MNCQTCRQELMRQPGRCSEAVHQHLRACPACAGELIAVLRFERSLYEAMSVPAAPGLEAKILQAQAEQCA